jgi:hypothetical protein
MLDMATNRDKAEVIKLVCRALLVGNSVEASRIAREEYPFTPSAKVSRKMTESRMTRIFLRDGFIDRYSGERLIFPGTLRLLSHLMPDEFPAHPNWKMSESHIVFWELFPTIDHVHPVARGGTNDDDNCVTTSMIRNSAKSNWTLEELGWRLVQPGDMQEWDGLLDWFTTLVSNDKAHLADTYLRRWYYAAKQSRAG